MEIDSSFFESDLYRWGVLPFLIFLCGASYVTLVTLRNILLSKSVKYIVPVLGFFEVFIWLIAITQIFKNLDNVACYIAWALGFALGILFGIKIEERLALGIQVMRVITNADCTKLVEDFHANNFGVTIVDGKGYKGPVKILFTILKRKDVPAAIELINRHAPASFYSIEDIRTINLGVFPGSRSIMSVDYFRKIFNR